MINNHPSLRSWHTEKGKADVSGNIQNTLRTFIAGRVQKLLSCFKDAKSEPRDELFEKPLHHQTIERDYAELSVEFRAAEDAFWTWVSRLNVFHYHGRWVLFNADGFVDDYETKVGARESARKKGLGKYDFYIKEVKMNLLKGRECDNG